MMVAGTLKPAERPSCLVSLPCMYISGTPATNTNRPDGTLAEMLQLPFGTITIYVQST